MAPAEPPQWSFVSRIREIAQEKHDGTAAHGPKDCVEAHAQVGPTTAGFEEQDVAQEALAVLQSLSRRDVVLHLVGHDSEPDTIIVVKGCKSENRSEFGHDGPLCQFVAAEIQARAAVDDKDHGQLAFFDESSDERLIQPSRDFPIDRAHIVARLVSADIDKSQTGAVKCAGIRARQQGVGGAAGAQSPVSARVGRFPQESEPSADDPSADGLSDRSLCCYCSGMPIR